MEEHIMILIKAAQDAGIKTFVYTSYEQMYDVKSEFLDYVDKI